MIRRVRNLARSNWLVGIYLIVIALTLFYIFSYNRVPADSFFDSQQDHVVKVIDGDTIEVLSGERVRLLAINAPEKGEPYSVEAKDKLKNLVEGKDVVLEFDQEKEDHYGRQLAYVFSGKTHINLVMVEEGLAWSYIVPPNDQYQYEIEMAEDHAKQSRIGIWSGLK
jgi:micrococcal nuclease